MMMSSINLNFKICWATLAYVRVRRERIMKLSSRNEFLNVRLCALNKFSRNVGCSSLHWINISRLLMDTPEIKEHENLTSSSGITSNGAALFWTRKNIFARTFIFSSLCLPFNKQTCSIKTFGSLNDLWLWLTGRPIIKSFSSSPFRFVAGAPNTKINFFIDCEHD